MLLLTVGPYCHLIYMYNIISQHAGIGRSKDVLQSSHEQETTKLVEERNTLKRTLSSKQVKLRTMEEERKAYEKQVCAWKSY